MDAAILSEAIDYEQLTKATYEAILAKEGVQTVKVEHNVKVKGRSGVEHQIDVFWEFKQAGVTHRVLIECKNYASNLTLEKPRQPTSLRRSWRTCARRGSRARPKSAKGPSIDRLDDKEQNRNFGTVRLSPRLPFARPFLGVGWNRVGVTLRRGD